MSWKALEAEEAAQGLHLKFSYGIKSSLSFRPNQRQFVLGADQWREE